MTDTATVLREREAKSLRRLERLRSSVAALELEVAELRTALKVLTNLKLIEPDGEASDEDTAAAEPLNENQAAVLEHVPIGENAAMAPRTIIKSLEFVGQALNGDYVRTVLWRSAQRGLIKNKNGYYWRENEEAPDAETSEASKELGPADGSQGGATHLHPEGSIPSGSTHHRVFVVDDSADDDSSY